MGNVVNGAALVAIGCALIIFRKPFTKISVGFQNSVFHFHFGEKDIMLGYWLVPIFGLVFIVGGILVLLGIAK